MGGLQFQRRRFKAYEMTMYDCPIPKYRDRNDAGEVDVSKLLDYRGKGLVVLAIPNGGVPVGAGTLAPLEAEDTERVVQVGKQFNLDFDDAYQYSAAAKRGGKNQREF